MEHVDFTTGSLPETAAFVPATAARQSAFAGVREARFSLISNVSALAVLEDGWRALEERSARSHNVFQSFDWCSAWARTYTSESSACELSVIAGYRNDSLAFIWPLMRLRQGPIHVLRWLSEPFAQYGDVLVAAGEDARPWMRAAWDFIGKLRGVSAVRLRHVREDAAAYAFLRESFRSARHSDAAPFLDLTPFPDEEAYERRYSKEQRKRRRKIRKDLEAEGTVEFSLLRAGSDMDAAMQSALAEKRKWLSARGLYSHALNCPSLLRFLKELSRSSRCENRLVTSLLTAGGKPISWEIGLRFKDRHHGFITAHDTTRTDASPARLHMDLAQRRAIADGMKVFDLMVPNDPHKESWSCGAVRVHDFYAPVSLTGALYGHIYLERLRPLLRRAYYNAPPAVRHRLTGIAHMKAKLR